MATKVYKLNQPKNSASFTLTTNHGRMTVGYEFKGGNQTTMVAATCTLTNEFYQQLLENSTLFKNGIVKLERVFENKTDGKATNKPAVKQVEEITSPEQAITYVFDTWGAVVKTAKEAVRVAKAKGVEFPNLTEKKTDK